MKRLLRLTLYAGSAAAGGLILWGAETASATGGDDGGLGATDQAQEVVVDNTTTQGGTADVTNNQTNLNLPVAIASPGSNSGDVDQSNEADNSAAVVNSNSTDQSVAQSQDGIATATGGDASGGGDGGDGTSEVGQSQSANASNGTDQSGDASVNNSQINVNIPVAVLSPGANGGDVDQSNDADNTAAVINQNSTDQTVEQSQSGDATATGGDATGGGGNPCDPCSGGHGGDAGDGTAIVDQGQSADVDNGTSQGGSATVDNSQENQNGAAARPAPKPEHGANNGDHGACGCRPPAPANGGDVDQSNEADNSAAVENGNETDQSVEQSQDGAATATGGDASGRGDGGDGVAIVDQDQSAGVSNGTDQGGNASVENRQININVPVAIASPGANSGDVDQSNEADNTAAVINRNSTDQSVGQSQNGTATASGGDAAGGGGHQCGCSGGRAGHGGDAGDGVAIVDQDQSADVDNGTSQGGSATVDNSQENLNGATPRPALVRENGGHNGGCGCHPPAPTNGGDVDQSNEAHNAAFVINGNRTDQSVEQSQDGSSTATGGDASGRGGHPCGCEHRGGHGGDAGDGFALVDQDQWAGVDNGTSQGGSASVDNDQENVNEPAHPAGHNGAPHNGDSHKGDLHKGDSHQGDRCGCRPPAQADGGDVDQSNEADNIAFVDNLNGTSQSVDQSQDGTATATGGNASGGGGDGGDGTAIVDQDQWAGVSNRTDQGGTAWVGNDQENINTPGPEHQTDSKGCRCEHPKPARAGDVDQSNEAANTAAVVNGNVTDQSVGQSQIGDATASGGDATGGDDHHCGCKDDRKGGDDHQCVCKHDRKGGDGGDGTAIVDQDQAARLSNTTGQGGRAGIANDQDNTNGGGGDVGQSNDTANTAAVVNDNVTRQAGRQGQLASALGYAV